MIVGRAHSLTNPRLNPTQGVDDLVFNLRSRHAGDRSGIMLMPLQNCLRDIIAPALGPLLRPGWTHPIAAIIEQFSDQQSLGRLTLPYRLCCRRMVLEPLLYPAP